MAGGGQTPALLLHFTWQKVIMPTGHLPAPTQISTVWVAAVMSCIIQGNATNDTLTRGGAINFAVHEAFCQLRQSLGQFKLKIHLTSH